MPAAPITIALLDDHPVVLNGLRAALHAGMLCVMGQFGRIEDLFKALDAYETAHRKPVDIAIIDYNLGPDAVDGISLIQRMRRRHPGTKLIVMTAMEQDGIKTLALTAGAHGFIGKSVSMEAVPAHVLTVMRNRQVVDPPLRQSSTSYAQPAHATVGLKALSGREVEVFRCLVEGMTTGQIARKFVRAPSTISTQVGSLFQKLGVASINEFLSQKAVWATLLRDLEGAGPR
jgi:DNA-binding NarL/FixJ family response regulator